MKKNILFCLSAILVACSNSPSQSETANEQFTAELESLKAYFQIPGIAVIVKQKNQILYEQYMGYADVSSQTPMDSTITIPMASLTKIFTGTLVMKLVEDGKISLEYPVSQYIEGSKLPNSIQIQHILSHTSQGVPGEHFYYNNFRFSLLGQIIENVTGNSFKSNVNDRIIAPLKLTNTYLLQDTAQVTAENRKIASPYFLGGEMKDDHQEKIISDGFIDYGYSAAAGITSTVGDLARFSSALDNGEIMSTETRNTMFSPFRPDLPYGLGVFSQELMGERLVWGYGQYDCYSSLLLKVPDKDLVFVIAANNNLMSDPARLINGDVGYSLFALSFLKNFVFGLKDVPLLEDDRSLENVSANINEGNSEFYLKKLIGQSVAASFMARFDDQETELSKRILRIIFDHHAESQSYSDLTLMHNLNMLKFIDGFRGKPDFEEFDAQMIRIGKSLLTIDENNPYANYYMANYYGSKGMKDSTSYYFNQLIDAKNFTRWWYTSEAEQWLKENQAVTKID